MRPARRNANRRSSAQPRRLPTGGPAEAIQGAPALRPGQPSTLPDAPRSHRRHRCMTGLAGTGDKGVRVPVSFSLRGTCGIAGMPEAAPAPCQFRRERYAIGAPQLRRGIALRRTGATPERPAVRRQDPVRAVAGAAGATGSQRGQGAGHGLVSFTPVARRIRDALLGAQEPIRQNCYLGPYALLAPYPTRVATRPKRLRCSTALGHGLAPGDLDARATLATQPPMHPELAR